MLISQCGKVWWQWTARHADEVFMNRRRVGLQIGPLLERKQQSSMHHAPVFAAISHGYIEVVQLLVNNGLCPDEPACQEHVEVNRTKWLNCVAARIQSMQMLSALANDLRISKSRDRRPLQL